MITLSPPPPELTAPDAPVALITPPPVGERRWPRPFVLVAAAVALAVAIGLMAPGGFWPDADLVKRQALTDGLKDIRLALENFATDHNGEYPPAAIWLAALKQPGNQTRPDHRPPTNPWDPAGGPLAIARGPWPAALPRAAGVASGTQTLPPSGLDLGPGYLPGEGPADALTFGTVFYDYDPATQVYVVYAIGNVGGHATLIAALTNAAC